MLNKNYLLYVLFFFLIVANTSALLGQSFVDYEGVRLSLLPDIQAKGYLGYHFNRVMAANNSQKNRQIRIFLRADYSRALEEVSKTFTIAPGEVREEALFFPVLDISSPGLSVEIDGVLLTNEKLTRHQRIYRNFYGKFQALVDSKIAQKDFADAFNSRGKTEVEINQFEGSASQLYRNWLGYSQFNLLLFRADTLQEMPLPVFGAILDYVRAGGTLLVLGEISLPDDFKRIFRKDYSLTEYSLAEYNGGFGRVFSGPEDLLVEMPKKSHVFPDVFSNPFAGSSPQHASYIEFKNREIESVSAKWLMLVIYAFAFFIGPVNIFVLHRMKKRILVFLTVPVASAICCFFIYGYYWFFESRTLLTREKSITLLDENNNRAITLGGYSIFASRSRPEGLKFDLNTEVFPFFRHSYRSSEAGFYYSLGDMQYFTDGWIRPKIVRSFNLRMIQTRRERISLEREGNNVYLVNGLGVDLRRLLLRSAEGIFYTVENTKAGQRSLLQIKPQKSAARIIEPVDVFKAGWGSSFEHMQSSAVSYLKPGQYMAVLAHSPFFSQDLDSSSIRDSEAIVWGIMKRGASDDN